MFFSLIYYIFTYLVLQISEQKVLLDSIIDYVLDNYKNSTFAILAPAGVAKEIDERLWQEEEESFIPHHCAISFIYSFTHLFI